MPAKTTKNGTKNASKSQAKAAAKKPAAKKAPVSRTPLLDDAKAVNPHKAEGAGGWDKAAAVGLAAEFASLVTEEMTVKDMLALENEYKTFTGWKNAHEAVLSKFGLKRLNTRSLAPASAE